MNYRDRSERERNVSRTSRRGSSYGYGREGSSYRGREEEFENRPDFDRGSYGGTRGSTNEAWDDDYARSGRELERGEEGEFGEYRGEARGNWRSEGGRDYGDARSGRGEGESSSRPYGGYESSGGRSGGYGGGYGGVGEGGSYGGRGSSSSDSMPGRSDQFYADRSSRGWQSGSQSGRGSRSGQDWRGGSWDTYGTGSPSMSSGYQGSSFESGSHSRGDQGGYSSGGRSWSSSGSMSSERGGEHRGKGPKGYKRSDDRIREDVSEELKEHGDVDASDIEIEVHDGDVTLRGEVRTRREKRLAEECIEGVAGVQDVQNQLRVRTQNSGESGDDSRKQGGGSQSTSRTGSSTQAGLSSHSGSSTSSSSTQRQGASSTTRSNP